jgi:DNA segregation ATPase FtsK/SpoIIIE-like protein
MCKNIGDYNENCGNLPYIVCIIDEFFDLIASDKKVEGYIQRLAQKARAAGIHIILATQRPSVDVVTGVLKANFPTRLAYKVASSADSRTILDTAGAEDLIGRGDALYLASDGQLKRIHGAYIDDKKIAEFLEPLRTTIKPIALPQNQTADDEKKSDKKTEKNKKPWWKKVLDFWESLRQKDKKIIINAMFALLEFLFGTKEKEKKKKLTKK